MHVYLITNSVNGKIYVGQHKGPDLEKYLNQKFSDKRKNSHLHNAFKVYGRPSFTIKSLVRPIDKPQMDALEKFFIRTFDSRNPEIGYNETEGGEGAWGYRHTESAKRNISEKMTGRPVTDEFRWKIGQLKKGQKGCLGFKRSAAECKAIGERSKGNKYALGMVRSAGTRSRMSIAAKEREAKKSRVIIETKPPSGTPEYRKWWRQNNQDKVSGYKKNIQEKREAAYAARQSGAV